MVHNARVKLVATALNNLGVAAIIYGIIAPRLNGQGDDPVVFLFGFTAGIVHLIRAVDPQRASAAAVITSAVP